MPIRSTWVDPEIMLHHNGVTIYCTYEGDDFNQGRLNYHFVLDPLEQEGGETVFDVRELPAPTEGPSLNDEPAYISRREAGFDTVEAWQASEECKRRTSEWQTWLQVGRAEAVRNTLRWAIDAGHFDKWRVEEEPEPQTFHVRLWATFRAMSEDTIEAMDYDDAIAKAKELEFQYYNFTIEEGQPDGDESVHVFSEEDWTDGEPVEVDRRSLGAVFSWEACNLVDELAARSLPDDETPGDPSRSFDPKHEVAAFHDFIRAARDLKRPLESEDNQREEAA